MEVKKNPKANLEKSKGIFLEIGYVVVLAIILIAFQWKDTGESKNTLGVLGDMDIEEEIIPITRQEEVKPPPPPPPKVIEVLNIVEDDVEIEEELEIEDTEADQDTEIEIEVYEEPEEEEIFGFYVLEDKPTFPGGEIGLMKYLVKHTKYPEIAKENDVTGKVYVQFVIDKKGKVTDVKLMRGVDPALDKEALRVVRALPDWKPGKQRGKPVKVSFQVPISFTLY